MPDNQTELPEFNSPPVGEVVHGVSFRSLDLTAVHLGLLWLEYRDQYPEYVDKAPLATPIEPGDKLEFQLRSTPPLPRVWFVSDEKRYILQVQQDRFLHNWRRLSSEDEYPGYGTVSDLFWKRLDTFAEFCDAHGLPALHLTQFELTYINNIPFDYEHRDLSELLPDFCWRRKGRLLEEPEHFTWRTVFRLPENQGRLHTQVRSNSKNGQRSITLEFTARGSGQEPRTWFDTTHDFIVRSFEDFTAPDLRKDEWKQI